MEQWSWQDARVLVTGGAGFVGSHIVENLVTRRGVDRHRIRVVRSAECDLRKYEDCRRAVAGCDVVIHLAAVTGGISFARQFPASQYYDSTLIDLNMVEAARMEGVRKFVAIGNLFAYPPDAPSPLKEEQLFGSLPMPAHRGVGMMKRNLAVIADLYHRQYEFPMVVVYCANAYGPRDSIDSVMAHVIPATIMKCFRDPELVVWGDGSPTRDFLYVKDAAEGLLLALERLEPPNYINIGSGREVSVRELVSTIAKACDFRGPITFDSSKSGGDARRGTSIDRSKDLLGFTPTTSLKAGLRETIDWYRAELGVAKA
jgi:GDP-L-fucose synthase